MKKLTTKQLENTMIRYRDLVGIPVTDIGEQMVVLNPAVIRNGYPRQMSDMAEVLDDKIVLRKAVISMLLAAQKRLRKRNNNFSLYVTYGYRSLEAQTKIFRTIASRVLRKRFFSDPTDFYEEVHRFIAVPTVAGHPTGGAVDITIIDSAGKFLNFGSPLYDFSSKDCYVYAPNISKQALTKRLLLRECMTAAGFAPFDGEWWHFSYGDREWAYYYKKPNALYSQISVFQVKSNLLQ